MAQALTQTYLELMARILETREDLPGRQHTDLDVRHVDMYYGQDLGPDGGIRLDQMPFNMRAVLIEFEPIEWRSTGRHRQRAEGVRINLHIVSQCKLETASSTPPFQRNEALAHLSFVDSLTYRLTGWAGTWTTSLSRVGLRPYESRGVVIKHVLTFECAMEDDAAMRTTQATPTLDLDLTVTPQPE